MRSPARPTLRVPLLAALLASVCLLPAAPRAQAQEEFDERRQNVFFAQPDAETRRRITALIDDVASGGPMERKQKRHDLVEIGYWTVEPLAHAVKTLDPQVQCGCILALEAIGDARAIPQLRRTVEVERSHPNVAAFATLALGRYRDPAAVDSMREALDSPKTMNILRAAVPLALARLRTDDALTLLRERLGNDRFDKGEVVAARLLALGFFPQAALDAGGPSPSAALRAGLTSDDKSDRQAAILAYLVATLGRKDTRSQLVAFEEAEDWQFAVLPALLGISAYDDPAATLHLVRAAQRHPRDRVRRYALDLLCRRGDPAAQDGLIKLIHASSPLIRARAVLALSSIEGEKAAKAVMHQLSSQSPLTRAAAAVGCVRLRSDALRQVAATRIKARLRAGESHKGVRANLHLAASILAGERSDVSWVRVSGSPIFERMGWTYEDRLLALVNARANNSLFLWKVKELSTDAELASEGPPGSGETEGGGGADESGGGEDDGGSGDPEFTDPGGGGSDPDSPAPGPPDSAGDGSGDGNAPSRFSGAPTAGAPRVNQHQELRDLKIRLLDAPYFTFDDLPGARRPDVTDD